MQIENNHPQISFGSKQVESIPWVERYRPHQLNDLISHQSILSTLKTFLKDNNLPNLLFYGPPGTGKTSTILALAKQLYQKDFKSMVLELNASDERGINVVRDLIKSFAGSGTLSRNQNVKLVILDEADMMTKAAQFALRRIIEKYHSNARFCLVSNYVSKIIPALQSRCTRFKFKQISFEEAKNRIIQICRNERLNISHNAIEAVFKLCQGDMRRVVNMLQSLSMIDSTQEITEDRVYDFTGNPSPRFLNSIINNLFNEDFNYCMTKIGDELKHLGIALETIVRQLYQMILVRIMPSEQKAFLVKRLGDVEYRLSLGCQQKTCLASLIGAFIQIRNILFKKHRQYFGQFINVRLINLKDCPKIIIDQFMRTVDNLLKTITLYFQSIMAQQNNMVFSPQKFNFQLLMESFFVKLTNAIVDPINQLNKTMGQEFSKLNNTMGQGFSELKNTMGQGFSELKNTMGQGFSELNKTMGQGFSELNEKMGQGFQGMNKSMSEVQQGIQKIGLKISQLNSQNKDSKSSESRNISQIEGRLEASNLNADILREFMAQPKELMNKYEINEEKDEMNENENENEEKSVILKKEFRE